jgi:hypothetical protein
MCKPKTPKIEQAAATPPAPTPAPAAPSAAVAQADPQSPEVGSEDATTKMKRKGRNALKIDLTMGGTGGGSGLNVPN